MAKPYSGENTLTYLITLMKTALAGKLDRGDVVNDLTSADPGKVLSAAQGKALAERIQNAGGGDMLSTTPTATGSRTTPCVWRAAPPATSPPPPPSRPMSPVSRASPGAWSP